MTVFTAAAAATLAAILKIFFVMAVAGFLVRRRILTGEMVTALSRATIVVFLPAMIFDKVTTNFDPVSTPLWWTLPLAAVVMVAVGLALAALVFCRELPDKRNMLAVAAMQNSGYLVLPVGLALFPNRFDEFALYTFLFITGFNPMLWSVGKVLATDDASRRGGWLGALNPPLVACLISISTALLGLGRWIPAPVSQAIEMVGQGAVPVATVVLGAMLGGMPVRWRPHLWDAARVLLVKFVLIPALTVGALLAAGIGGSNPLLAQFLVLQAAAAPAANLIVQVRAYGGDEQKVGTVMLISYIACIVSLPVWLAVWELVS
ncbi:MAG: AEC family transporter [Thermoanaerobaculales bacterium]|jgi:predicted permease|nr:AEC family transporter [Thermoanaerobaculales bacterium]